MSRYIDADALIEVLKQRGIALSGTIADAPSIDIVFCKECKYEKRCTTNVHFLADNGLDVIPVRFCSYGEREGE
nr:hypothetical protein [Clostridia bacterium]